MDMYEKKTDEAGCTFLTKNNMVYFPVGDRIFAGCEYI